MDRAFTTLAAKRRKNTAQGVSPGIAMQSTRSELQLESARWTLSPMRGCADTPAAPTEYGRSRRASSAVEQFSKTLESRAPLREDLKIDLLGDLRANC